MGLPDRLVGGDRSPTNTPAPGSADEQAVKRFRYRMRAASPDATATASLDALPSVRRSTPCRPVSDRIQRSALITALPLGDAPAALARAATRTEMREPGTSGRTFSQQSRAVSSDAGCGAVLGAPILRPVTGTAATPTPADASTPEPPSSAAEDIGRVDTTDTDGDA